MISNKDKILIDSYKIHGNAILSLIKILEQNPELRASLDANGSEDETDRIYVCLLLQAVDTALAQKGKVVASGAGHSMVNAIIDCIDDLNVR